MGKIVSSILPIVGTVLGTVGGSFIGAPELGGVLGGALGGFGGAEMSGGNPFLGTALGGLGGAFGANAIGNAGFGAGLGAGNVGASSIFQNASDPIQAISNAMTATGTSTATDAAQALGFSNTNAMLASANPSWLSTGAAVQGLTNNATGGLIGGGANVGSFTGTLPSAAGGVANPLAAKGVLGIGAGQAGGLGPLTSLLSIGSSMYGMNQAAQMQALAKQMQGQNAYSGTASAQLNSLLQNPNSITSMPGYEAGLTAVQRSMAAQGYQGSGNMAAALQQYGGNFYNNAVSQLGGLAGQGNTGLAQSAQVANLGNQSASSALAALGYGVTGMGF